MAKETRWFAISRYVLVFPFRRPTSEHLFGSDINRQVTPEAPFVHFISTFQSSDPQRGIGMMPKRGCDVNTCEIAKFYRLTNNGLCQLISFTVPRRSELFQEDLYPDTLSDEPPNTAEEWLEGTDAEPILVSLKVSVNCSLKCEIWITKSWVRIFVECPLCASRLLFSLSITYLLQLRYFGDMPEKKNPFQTIQLLRLVCVRFRVRTWL